MAKRPLSPCQRPGWFESQLSGLSPPLQAAVRLHPNMLNDLGAPRARIWQRGKQPWAIAVEYGDGVFAYRWDGKKLTSASAKLFARMVSELPPTVRKKRIWRNRFMVEPKARGPGQSKPS